MITRLAKCLPLVLSVLVLGCGPATSEVTGTVTSAGKPVPDVQVVFLGQNGDTALARTDASGKYAVTAPVGNYQVSVTVPSTEATVPDSSDPYAIQTQYPFPQKYAAPGTSGLTYEITNSGTQTYDIKLD